MPISALNTPARAGVESGMEGSFFLSPKVVGYCIKFLNTSGSNAQAGLRMDHGPDSTTVKTHSTPIATAAIPADNLAIGDAASTPIIQEWIRPVVIAGSTSGTQSFTAEIFEMRKPF